MLRFAQLAFVLLAAVIVAAVSTWSYFRGGSWLFAALGSVIAFLALLSGALSKDETAWRNRSVRVLRRLLFSAPVPACIAVAVTAFAAGLACWWAYRARPLDTRYCEVHVYKGTDAPRNFQVGAVVVVSTRTDGVTRKAVVEADGTALFRAIPVPTTLTYQIGVVASTPPYEIWGQKIVETLPAMIPVDVAAVPAEDRRPFSLGAMVPLKVRARIEAPPASAAAYLERIEQRGDPSLQVGNAPWGIPRADLIVNRLSYVLGYDLERRMPRWVAYAVGPSDDRVARPTRFEVDPAIAADRQAKSSDYVGSGYDRGHLISPADLYFKGPIAVTEAFYMSTVAPQTPWFNQRLWSDVENRLRRTVKRDGAPAYVITGPVWENLPTERPRFLRTTAGAIPVPSHFFRVVAAKTSDGGLRAFALIVPNATEGSLRPEDYLVSISEVEHRSGLTFFPLLPTAAQQQLKQSVGPMW